MKTQQAIILATASTVASAARPAITQRELPSEISASSALGRSVLSQSRPLDGGRRLDEEDEYAWIAGYSLKFQGCRHAASFNLDADDEDDVKVSTTKLAHFRLCPAGSCESWLGGGCKSNYGDYVVDLATFAQAYVEGQRRTEEYACQMYMYENCDCQENDDKDDGWDRDYCEYDCYMDSKKYQGCVDRNPYDDDEEDERERRFEAQEYVECKEWEIPEADDDANQQNENNGDDDAEEVQYYIGPYCSSDGGAVYLGLYTDETCTNFADDNKGRTTYKSLSYGNEDLPYSTTSVVTSDCVSCIEQEDPNRRDEEDDDDGEAAPEVSDQCGRLYESAGKCESSIDLTSSGMSSDPNTEACSYISGIRFTKLNGIVDTPKASGAATFFVVLFAGVFIGLAGMVYRLREQIKRAGDGPLLEKEDSQEDKPVLS
mmetsp:Transcript_47594/g.101142  ORF Transcript_47594/g.101142 Transcript_47594/m.101142 type:complete len:430 (-) Transcript_47594:163-1452(-)